MDTKRAQAERLLQELRDDLWTLQRDLNNVCDLMDAGWWHIARGRLQQLLGRPAGDWPASPERGIARYVALRRAQEAGQPVDAAALAQAWSDLQALVEGASP